MPGREGVSFGTAEPVAGHELARDTITVIHLSDLQFLVSTRGSVLRTPLPPGGEDG